MKLPTYVVSIDMMPYDVRWTSDSDFVMEKFPWDIYVPDQWKNRSDRGDPKLLYGPECVYEVEQPDAGNRVTYFSVVETLEVDLKDKEAVIEDFAEALSAKFDAFNEIGWEALELTQN